MDLEDGVCRRRGRALEQAILAAGWEQLAERGYGAFTIDAVAERAGTSRSVIYRRWPDREALAEAVLGFALQQDPVAAPDTGSLRGDMIELLRRFNAARSPLVPMMSVLIAAHFQESGRTLADVRRIVLGERHHDALAEVIERAVGRGEIDPARLTPRVRTVAVDLVRQEFLMTLKPLPEDEITAIVDEVFLPLVRP